jgi:hypothetical protein
LLAVPQTYFGEDLNDSLQPPDAIPDAPTRLPSSPNATREANRFLSRLSGASTESFEGFSAGAEPATLTFGADTATLSGFREVFDIPTETFNGVYPLTGDKTLVLQANSEGNFFRLDFNEPQGAFGFFCTDIEAAQLRVTLVTQGGSRTDFDLPFTLPQGSGGAAFFGVIDTGAPFVSVEFSRVGTSGDGFGFDDLTIGRVEQIQPEPPSASIDLYAGIEIIGTIGADYLLEYSETLEVGSWLPLATISLPTSPHVHIDLDSPNHQRRFYRVSIIPDE